MNKDGRGLCPRPEHLPSGCQGHRETKEYVGAEEARESMEKATHLHMQDVASC